ncbi:hypothetical protein LTR53_014925 [Teratosphaeriaceae sp. CCFEE 6253]|nr:hypothetical protein LTR53_014925 [Teratosphaeriaceae sp. CCFEE 6253]
MLIYVNGRAFATRSNLWHFLDLERSKCSTAYYWIDAICIDQSKYEERNHQRAQAATVYVWLGPSANSSDQAMDCLAEFHHTVPGSDRAKQKTWSDAQGRALLDLCQLSYWRRMWIVQEINLAEKILVCCGRKAIAWQSFEIVSRLLDHTLPRLEMGDPLLTPHATAVRTSDAMQVVDGKLYWSPTRFSDQAGALVYLLEHYRHMESSEIRDRVYGLLGLIESVAPGISEEPILPNYTLSESAIFAEVYRRLQSSPALADLDAKLRFIERLRDTLGVHASDPGVEEMKWEIQESFDFWSRSDGLLPQRPRFRGRSLVVPPRLTSGALSFFPTSSETAFHERL